MAGLNDKNDEKLQMEQATDWLRQFESATPQGKRKMAKQALRLMGAEKDRPLPGSRSVELGCAEPARRRHKIVKIQP